MSVEVVKQALAYIEEVDYGPYDKRPIVFALRAAIEQAEEQGSACDKDPRGCWNVRCQLGKVCVNTPPRQWQLLTDEEIEDLYFDKFSMGELKAFARAIEAKLKEKNT